jgi:hypothetical protein
MEVLMGGREERNGEISDFVELSQIKNLGQDDGYWIRGWKGFPIRWIIVSLEV